MELNYRKQPCPKCENEQVKFGYDDAGVGDETCYYKTKCNQCKKTIECIRNVLDEIDGTKDRNVIVRVCKGCRRVNTSKYCNKCNNMSNQLLNVEEDGVKIKFYMEWLLKLKYLMNTLLSSHSVCQHTTCEDTELERILREIRSPVYRRNPVIECFPNIGEKEHLSQSITESKELLEKLLSRIGTDGKHAQLLSKDSISISSCKETCICKLLKQKVSKVPPPSREEDEISMTLSKIPTIAENIITTIPEDDSGHSSHKAIPVIARKNRILPKKTPEINETIGTTPLKSINAFMKELTKTKKDVIQEKTNDKNFKKVYDKKNDEQQKYIDKQLADALLAHLQVAEVKSSSIFECDVENRAPEYIVKGTFLEPYDHSHAPKEPHSLYTTKNIVISSSGDLGASLKSSIKSRLSNLQKQNKKESALIQYQLSNRAFIDNGWTQLPQEKIMRRMNLYKMEPANADNNWFERYKTKETLYYDSGELLARIRVDGCGIWFYRNGSKALEYYSPKDKVYGPRCLVFSCAEIGTPKAKLQTVLGEFDFLGNGVIYDSSGNVRIKYNQSEGVVVDSKIGSTCRWKWHSLNDPPVLNMLMIDSHLEPKDTYLETLQSEKGSEPNPPNTTSRQSEMIMLRLEAAQLVKNKIKSKFRPLVLRTKVVKINDNFAVRISDQTNIVLSYRSRSTGLKLNLGMVLKSTEIIGYSFSKANDVELLYPSKYSTD